MPWRRSLRDLLLFASAAPAWLSSPAAARTPDDFVDLEQAVPGLRVDARYAGSDNFTGAPVEGYEAPRALATRQMAEALLRVQQELAPDGLGLLVFDAYRPERAVAAFMRWAEAPDEAAAKRRFYPNVPKDRLVPLGYIAARSSHSRGSTVDLTLVALDAGGSARPLEMGTPFDFFDRTSWPDSEAIPTVAQENRRRLRELMLRHGFEPYPMEWWHFTLRDEPYPERAFDFPVR